MQYKSETEKVAPITASYIPVSQGISPANDPQIQRTRKILIILLGVCLGLAVVSLFAGIFGSSIHVENENAQRGPQIGQALLSILFYSFGIFAAYRYSSLALRIFAWLTVIAVVLTGIAFVFLVLFGIVALIGVTHAAKGNSIGILIGGTIAVLFVASICVAAIILSIIIIKFSFKLARLIDANKNVAIQQI